MRVVPVCLGPFERLSAVATVIEFEVDEKGASNGRCGSGCQRLVSALAISKEALGPKRKHSPLRWAMGQIVFK